VNMNFWLDYELNLEFDMLMTCEKPKKYYCYGWNWVSPSLPGRMLKTRLKRVRGGMLTGREYLPKCQFVVTVTNSHTKAYTTNTNKIRIKPISSAS